jgi:outer membrane protein assembly factor BamB
MKVPSLLLLALGALLAGCAGGSGTELPVNADFDFLAATDFPKFQGDERNTGRANGSGATGVTKWQVDLGASIVSTPILGFDGMLYVMTDKGDLIALRRESGEVIWQAHVGGRGFSTPALGSDNHIYVGGSDGVWAVDAETGDLLWQQETDREVESSPNIGAGGSIFVGSSDGLMFNIDDETGGAYWWLRAGDSIRSSPALGRSEIYSNCDDGKMYVFDRQRIGILWTFIPDTFTPGLIYSSPALADDGTIYTALGDGLFAIDPRTQTRKWKFQKAAGMRGTPALSRLPLVVVGCNDGRLYAVDSRTGTEKWSRDIEVYSTVSIAGDNTVYAGSLRDGKLYALDGATGATKWSWSGGGILSAPSVDGDGTLYVGTGQGKLYAIQ